MGLFKYLALVLIIPMVFYLSFAIRRLLKSFSFFNDKNVLVIVITVVLCLGLVIASSSIFSIGTIFTLYLFFACLLIQIIHIFWKNETLYRWQIVIALGITAVIVIIGAINMNSIKKTSYEINTGKNLNLKIALISDLHLGVNMHADEFGEYIKEAEGSGADVLLLGGDMFDESTSRADMETTCDNLSKLNFKYGIFYVYGNHDSNRYRSDADFTNDEMTASLENAGVKILRGETARLGEGVTLLGLFDKSKQERGDISSIIKKAREDAPSDYLIVLDHQPVDFEVKEEAGVDLNISGHTHAGQIWPLSIIERFISGNDLVYGEKDFGNMKAITTAGIAGWGYPIRTEGRCEWVLIELK